MVVVDGSMDDKRMDVLHVYFHGGWMRNRGVLVVMLHGREIVVEQCLWCMVEWMTF
jgi:hypothetical protein